MDAQRIVKQIHEKIASETGATVAGDGTPVMPGISSSDRSELSAMKFSFRAAYESRDLVGRTPPSPESFRARVGGLFVRIVQRMLFWYTPQIRRFHGDVTATLGAACGLVERQAGVIAVLQEDVRTLRRRVGVLESRSQSDFIAVGRAAGEAGLPDSFQYLLQDQFRGSESDTEQKLRHWLTTIESVGPTHEGLWVDIGCGRGEWLSLVKDRGHQVKGLDSNPASIRRCAAKGLDCTSVDALDFLRAQPDASIAVLTAFHVVEHLSTATLLAITIQAARVLQPGGVFAVETPNPANLQMGAHQFWNDPTHVHPVPTSLMRLILEHCGLRCVAQFGLNPAPENEHLPYRELEPVRRIDDLLYGPRDYGMVARRDA